MKGADYIAQFLASKQLEHVFLMTGGAAAFMIDAVGRHKQLKLHCFHHEQAAAMAADAVWRVSGRVGVTMATSGPGATNLITGIACSYFDSIPSLHITGQVNMQESASYLGAQPRQAGFQETKIVEMVRPITKYAVQLKSAQELKEELEKAWQVATTGRMGPVLIDVPMDVQQMEVGEFIPATEPSPTQPSAEALENARQALAAFLQEAERPLIYFGAGVGLAGAETAVEEWLVASGIPFVSSWNGATYFDHAASNYGGSVGVYGNRGANFLVQNCDRLLVLGSRLDNRQRSANAKQFAPHAKVLAMDIDAEELAKFQPNGYETICMDLRYLPALLQQIAVPPLSQPWRDYVARMKSRYYGKCFSSYAQKRGSQSPYEVVRRINALVDTNAIIVNDTGAALCWFFQAFQRRQQTVFTAGGNSPMGYSLPAAIGAKLAVPERQVICFCGDGGFQLNIQELATLHHLGLDMVIVVLNNGGYGIIKQFLDSNMQGRYFAVGAEYSLPDFKKVVEAYGLGYFRIEKTEQMTPAMFKQKGGVVLDVIIDPNTPIEPKVERGRPIHDQFPYMSEAEFAEGNAFFTYERMK